ncbi:MAG: SEC-C domain-containing protein [Blastocatellia bacterium]
MILYLAFLPLWWYSLQTLATIIGSAAHWIYRLFDARVVINPDGRVLRVFVSSSSSDAQTAASGLRLDTVTYGLPMLAALVIVTQADSLIAKIKALLIGLAVMNILTVPAVMAWAKLTTLGVDEKIPGGDRSSIFFYAFHGYAFSQPVVAVAVWLALMMLGLFKSRPRQKATPVIAVSRNAPCPCGSGRKYKRCCGASPSG